MLKAQAGHARGHAGHACRHGLALHHHAEGLLPDRGHRLHDRHHRRQRPTSPSRRWSERQRKVAEIVRADKARRLRQLDRRRGRTEHARQQRPHVHRAEAAQRARQHATQIIARLRQNANVVPGMQIFFQPIQNINLGGRLTKSQYQYTLQSSDTDDALSRSRPSCATRSRKLPGLLDVTTDLYVKNPQMTVDIDREKAAVYGVTVDQVRQELYNAFGSRQVATIYTPSNDYQVILETQAGVPAEPGRSQPHLPEDARTAQTVPLSAVTHFVPHGRAAAGQSPGSAAGGDDLVQPRARLLARPGGRRDPASSSATSACRRRSRPASRARRRCSRIRCAGRAS